MAGKFEAQVSAWVRKAKARQVAVFRESIERLIDIAQTPVAKGGNMPVATGFLRASGVMTRDGSLPRLAAAPAAGRAMKWDEGDISLTLAAASVSDVITFAYTANYARFVEYGSRGKAGRRFVALAAQRWQQIVSEVCSEVKRGA